MAYQQTNVGQTGQQLVNNLHNNFAELYGGVHSHANKNVLDNITSAPATVASVTAAQEVATAAGQTAATASAAAQAAAETAANAIPLTQKGAPGGVATLDGEGKVPATQLPASSGTANPADLISTQTPNALTLGSDNKLRVPPGGGGAFDGDHNDLDGRSVANAHPISAITGLADSLTNIGDAIEALDEDLGVMEQAINDIPAARDFTANPILEPELGQNAVVDSKIGNRAVLDQLPCFNG